MLTLYRILEADFTSGAQGLTSIIRLWADLKLFP